jgi:hypothetical protein
MRVIIDIGLDLSGQHKFHFQKSDRPGAIEVPEPILERWAKEKQAHMAAMQRWQRVLEEVDEHLYKPQP